MGYELHITRGRWCTDSAEYPISREEWRTVAEAWPGMAASSGAPAGALVYELQGSADSSPAGLWWRGGRVAVGASNADAADIARVAEALGARLVGDDGEVYVPDGTVTDDDPTSRPPLLARPLFINEVARAWRSMLNWQDSLDELPVSGQVLSTFVAIAMRDVATFDLPDGDTLIYRYQPTVHYGIQYFVVSMTRSFAVPDLAGGDIVDVTCELRYRSKPEGLLSHTQTERIAAVDPEKRREWLDSIAARPEWAVFDTLTPFDLAVCDKSVYNSQISQGLKALRLTRSR